MSVLCMNDMGVQIWSSEFKTVAIHLENPVCTPPFASEITLMLPFKFVEIACFVLQFFFFGGGGRGVQGFWENV